MFLQTCRLLIFWWSLWLRGSLRCYEKGLGWLRILSSQKGGVRISTCCFESSSPSIPIAACSNNITVFNSRCCTRICLDTTQKNNALFCQSFNLAYTAFWSIHAQILYIYIWWWCMWCTYVALVHGMASICCHFNIHARLMNGSNNLCT